MKTTQFKQEITKLGLKYRIVSYPKDEYINILTYNGDILASVSLSEYYVCFLTQTNIHKFTLAFREKLYELLDKYSTTPISERNESSIEESNITNRTNVRILLQDGKDIRFQSKLNGQKLLDLVEFQLIDNKTFFTIKQYDELSDYIAIRFDQIVMISVS